MNLSSAQVGLLEDIQSRLIRGDIGTIASNTGKSRGHVSRVLSVATANYDTEVVAEAVRIIELRAQDTKKLSKKVALAK